MRQRNDTDQPLTVHTDPPQVLQPGEEVDHDTYVVGLTAVPPPVVDATPAKTSKATAKETTTP